MSIKITWTNDEVVDEIRIYRSQTRVDLAALPTPLSTIAGDQVEFVDVTAKRGEIYYYVVAKVKNDTAPGANDGEVLYSPNSVHGYYPETGHGSNLLKRGSWEHGYFGQVAAAEFFTTQQFCSDFQAKTTLPLTPYGTDPVWHKFIYNGKILFIPQNTVTSTSLAWRQLYHAGAVFGDAESVGVYPPGLDYQPTQQDLTLELDGYSYIVRLIRFCTNPVADGLTEADLELHLDKHDPWITGSEYFQTIARLLASDFIRHSNPRIDNVMNFGTYGVNRFGQELSATEVEGVRTLSNLVTTGGASGTEQNLTTFNTETQVAYRYHPVLELIL